MAQETSDLLQKFAQEQDLLDLDRYKSDVNQLLFNLRMQNTQYIDNLKIEGAKSRLMDRNRFQEAMSEAVFADEIDLLKNDLGFRRAMQSSMLDAQGKAQDRSRTFEKYLSSIDIDMALKVAMADSDARNTAMQQQAITQIGQSVIKFGAQAYSDNKGIKATTSADATAAAGKTTPMYPAKEI